MIGRLVRRWDVWLFAASVVFFALFPRIDLTVAGWFYDPRVGFFLGRNPLVLVSYWFFGKVVFIGVVIGIVVLVASPWLLRGRHTPLRRYAVFLVVALALGPGLLVNGIVKEHSGRARPRQVTEFGGHHTYTPPFRLAHQCANNCSFVSGHASAGFFLIAFYWIFRRRAWLAAGIALGALAGLGRMAQGGHFLSDVVFAFWIVYGSTLLVAHWVLPRRPRAPPATDGAGEPGD